MSTIEWTEDTWNPVVGCTPVSPGCLNCYAATMARRLEAMGNHEYLPRVDSKPCECVLCCDGEHAGDCRDCAGWGESDGVFCEKCNGEGTCPVCAGTKTTSKNIRIAEVRGGRAVFTGEVRCLEDRLTIPMRWKKPRRIFVNSMSDLFHESVPFEFIDRVFAVMALCPQHTFQVLTKRHERMVEYVQKAATESGVHDAFYDWLLPLLGRKSAEYLNAASDIIDAQGGIGFVGKSVFPHICLGVSVENQAAADERVPALVELGKAGWRTFISQEPQIGPVVYRDEWATHIDLVIVGGESGKDARPFDVAWARQTLAWCRRLGVPFFLKQLGARVMCRNDQVSDWLDQPGGGCLEDIETEGVVMQGDLVRVHLTSRKGSEMAEWPEDLRVRKPARVRDGGGR